MEAAGERKRGRVAGAFARAAGGLHISAFCQGKDARRKRMNAAFRVKSSVDAWIQIGEMAEEEQCWEGDTGTEERVSGGGGAVYCSRIRPV